MNLLKWIGSAAAVAFALVSATAPAHASTVEKVSLWDKDGAYGITIADHSLKAGSVTFNVTNRASSNMEHEMLVIRLTPAQVANPDSLPYSADESKIIEDKVDDLGEVAELEPGQSGSLTVDMTPGTYMLVCNIAGHYRFKMYTEIEVK